MKFLICSYCKSIFGCQGIICEECQIEKCNAENLKILVNAKYEIGLCPQCTTRLRKILGL
jgi:hypothetical protein